MTRSCVPLAAAAVLVVMACLLPAAASALPADGAGPVTSASASEKLQALRALVEGAAEAATESAACTARKGTCMAKTSCRGSVVTGLCPGSSSIACCVAAASSTTPAPAPRPIPTPAPAPAPAASKCGAIGGQCVASCAYFATAGLCPGASVCCSPYSADPFVRIGQVASNAVGACAKHTFTSQHKKQPSVAGKAPKAFLRGVAYTYAKAVCQPARPDVAFVGQAKVIGRTADPADDVMHQYKSVFAAAGLSMAQSGLPVVRHLYTLLLGLGMCESGGRACTGRDMTSDFSSASACEAGLFQTSYNPHRMSQHMSTLMAQYQRSRAGCFREQFYEGITCSAANWQSWGEASHPGFQWQQLTKECPAFAVEYAAVLLRVHGGIKGEWMPLRRQYAEVRPECDAMLQQVEMIVQQNPSVCARLLA